MPLFDFCCPNPNCPKHNDTVELIAKADEMPLCEECEMPLIKQLPKRTGFRLAGGGWANEGYS